MEGHRMQETAVYLELGSKRVFAAAVNWPGWCRSGKDERQALAALAAAAPRYAPVAEEAGIPFPDASSLAFQVVERLPGSSTTDFGAPASIATQDGHPCLGDRGPEPVAGKKIMLPPFAWGELHRQILELANHRLSGYVLPPNDLNVRSIGVAFDPGRVGRIVRLDLAEHLIGRRYEITIPKS